MKLARYFLMLVLLAACSNAATPSGPVAVSTVDVANSPCRGVRTPAGLNLAPGGSKKWSAPEQVIDTSHTYCAVLTTQKGTIVAELYPKAAPKNVNNFVFLAQQGFFNGITFHRVLPEFMAQTGDPPGTGMGGPGYNVPLEIHPALKYDKAGVVGVARSRSKDSAGSQFFITSVPYPSLDPSPDNEGYTIIGQVVEGLDAVLGIRLRDPDQAPNYPGDTLVSVAVIDLTTNPKK